MVFFHGGGWQEKSTARSAAPVVNEKARIVVLLDDAEHYSRSKPEGPQWKAARKAILQQIHTETNP
ncbi:hypothetical protein JCM12107_02670 [Corynebacterium simulans]